MRKLAAVCLCMVFGFLSGNTLLAQNYVYQTGSPTFSVQIPIENGFINVNNGDIHVEIPLATQAQRGKLRLDEKLVYDSRIWKIVNNGGYSWQPTNVPNSMGGWRFISGIQAGTTAQRAFGTTSSQGITCQIGPRYEYDVHQSWITYYNFTWTDPQGAVHPFAFTTIFPEVVCNGSNYNSPTARGYALDGSGYYAEVTDYTKMTVWDKQGDEYNVSLINSDPAAGTPEVVDSDGNYWSSDANGNLVDTLGRTPVEVTTNGNQITYSVLTFGGARANYIVTTETVNYSTDFQQQAVSEASGSFTAIRSIQLPDGSSYSFTYGSYGELTSVTLPTGGVIGYAWQNYEDSYQNENRWVASRTWNGSTMTFHPEVLSDCTSSSGCEEEDTVTDPEGNDTVYFFTLDDGSVLNGGSWNTEIDKYQGPSTGGGTLLRSQKTTYTYTNVGGPIVNGVEIGSYEAPASMITTTTLPAVGLSRQTVTDLDELGNPTSVQQWDYYSGSAPANPALQTDYTYGYSVSSGELLTSVTQKDGSGNQISQTTYSYDQTTPVATSGLPNHESVSGNDRGNLTTVLQWINTSGSTLNTTMTYDDAGTLLSSTGPTGTTSYGHDSTDTFVTSTTPPTPSSGVQLTSTASYDPSTGLLTSATDPNGQTTTYKSYDEFGRPTEIDDPDGGKTTFSYTPNQTSEYRYQNAGTYEDVETLYDGYGRVSRVAVANGQGSNPWYQQDTCYNPDGEVSFRSYRYQGNEWSTPEVCAGAGDAYTYDALGRTTEVAHGDGTAIHYAYTGRATEVTGENGVSRIIQTDGLGRTTEVCEISSDSSMPDSGAPVSCGTDIAGTGFITNYAYNLANHETTITQGAQTRVFQTDSLGRTILTQEPESGQTTWSYAYNGTGLVVSRVRPRANQTGSSVTTTTTYQYDALDRLLSISYSDGTPTKEFAYDQATIWGNSSVSTGDAKGRLTAATSSVNSQAFVYDAMGRVTANLQCLPTMCGNSAEDKWTYYSYDWLGNVITSSDRAGVTTTYGYSPADEVTSIISSLSDSTHPPDLVSNIQSGPDGPLSWLLGNGLYGVRSYDAMGRNDGGWLCSGSDQQYCSGGSQLYGYTLVWSGARVTAVCDTVLNHCFGYGYDDFNRLASQTVNTGTPENFTYVYDRYGNRWQQNVTAGSGPSPQLSFNPSNNQITTGGYGYDAAGNMTSDGIHTYTYDADGNVIAVDGGATATYAYNALNQRVEVKSGGDGQEFVFNLNGRRISTWDVNSGGQIQGQVYWGSMPVEFYENSAAHFEHQDWEGTERLQTSYNGAMEGAYTSLPYGDGYSASGSDIDPYHFAMLDHDDTSNTDHAHFRQYSNMAGRWMSPDPYSGSYNLSNPQGFNRYSYVMNDPLAFTDLSGQFMEGPAAIAGTSICGPVCGGIAAGVAAVASALGLSAIFGPHFQGSLRPRPNVTQTVGNPYSSNGVYTYPIKVDVSYPSYGAGTATGEYGSTGGIAAIGAVTETGFLTQNNNSADHTTLMGVKQKITKFVCKSSPTARVFDSVKQGAIVGVVRGGASGFIGGEITEPLGGGIPGAILGGFLGGTLGASGGVFTGSAIALGCSIAGAYVGGS